MHTDSSIHLSEGALAISRSHGGLYVRTPYLIKASSRDSAVKISPFFFPIPLMSQERKKRASLRLPNM